MSTARVAAPYRSPYPNPVAWKAGDSLRVLPRSSEWPEWSWCEDGSGKKAWVPSVLLAVGRDRAALLEDYDSTELTVHAGDRVEILRRLAAWSWCRDGSGGEGWVPDAYLEPVE